MSAPQLTEHGVLPPGTHEMTLARVLSAFGLGGASRPELCSELARFLAGLAAHRIVQSVYVDGSFVTSKECPQDVDVCVTYDCDPDDAHAQSEFLALRSFVDTFSVANPRTIDAKIESVDACGAWLDLFTSRQLSSLYFYGESEHPKGIILLSEWREIRHT